MQSAEITIDAQFVQIRQGRIDLFLSQHLEHIAHFFTGATAVKTRIFRLENPDGLFPEQAAHQGADVGRQQFFMVQGRRQHQHAIPGVQLVVFLFFMRVRSGIAAMFG